MINKRMWMSIILLLLVFVVGPAAADDSDNMDDMTSQQKKEILGMRIYFDKDLSVPEGQSCASCHDPKFGFSEPDTDRAVSQGAIDVRFGNRNSPTAAYAAFSPEPQWIDGTYTGGQFWDGRAANLTEQAKGPFLNPLEMNNPNKWSVIHKIQDSEYEGLFKEVYGDDAFDDVEMAYDNMADAIAAFEMTNKLNRFNSKYDRYLANKVKLTEKEQWGLNLFDDPNKGNCAACHPSTIGPYSDKPLFTDFTYDNLGVPSNLGMYGDTPYLKDYYPFYYPPIAPHFNPDGLAFIDYGLGAILNMDSEMGKMKVPTLRNVEKTPPYMHNGVFDNLYDVVHFYNTRDVEPWPTPEVSANVNMEELGNLGLTTEEEMAIVAFMKTLTDEPYKFVFPDNN